MEYRTDDARLTIEVMKEAVTRGALAVNYAKADKLLYDEGRISGAIVTDRVTGKPYEIRASLVINAAGPWVDTLREMDRSKEGKVLRLTKGIHLVFDVERFPLKQAVYFDTPDGRMVFAIPRDGKTYAGTTDTVYGGYGASPDDRRRSGICASSDQRNVPRCEADCYGCRIQLGRGTAAHL